QTDAAALGEMPGVGCEPVAEVDHRGRARRRQGPPGGEAGSRLELALAQRRADGAGRGLQLRALEQGEPRAGAADLAGEHQSVAGASPGAADERVGALAVADDRDRDEELARAGDVAAGEGRAAALGEGRHALEQLHAAVLVEV